VRVADVSAVAWHGIKSEKKKKPPKSINNGINSISPGVSWHISAWPSAGGGEDMTWRGDVQRKGNWQLYAGGKMSSIGRRARNSDQLKITL